jgi:hypothetical protein
MKLKMMLLTLAATGVIAGLAIAAPSGASPSEQCRAERASATFAATHNNKTFADFYGTNAKKSNAFGRCVAAKAKAKTHTTTQAQTTTQGQSATTAAAMCRAERASATFSATHNNKTFPDFYGTNADDSNAFGKCVSAKANAS